MSDQYEQRVLTIVKEPAVKVSRQDKKKTYVSMLASFEGAESWYYVDDDCPQWEDYHEGDVVNAKVKDWGTGRSVKAMQIVEGVHSAPAPQAGQSKPAKEGEQTTRAEKRRFICLQASVQSLPNNSTAEQCIYRAAEYELYVEHGAPAHIVAALTAQARLGGDVDSSDHEFPEF